MKVGKAVRSVKWNGVDPITLDHPKGWVIESTETGFRLFDGTEPDATLQSQSSVVIEKSAWRDHLHIDLPAPTRGNKKRGMTVDLVRLYPLRAAYSPSPVFHTAGKHNQLFLFYGLRYFLVHYRPVSNKHIATIGDAKAFAYEKVVDGYKITPIREAIKLKIPGEKKRTLSVGQSYVISESIFFSCTFLLSVHWWRFQSVPTPDSLPPVETDEVVDEVREATRLRHSIQAFVISFCVFTLGMILFSKPERKIVAQTEVVIKQPKIIPLKEPPKLVEKKPEPKVPEKKIAEIPKPTPPKKVAATPKPPKPYKPKQQLAKIPKPTPKPVAKATPPPTPKAPLPPAVGLIAKKTPPAPPPPNPNVQLMKSLSFLGANSSKPMAQVPTNYKNDKNQKYDPKAVAVGGGSSKSVLNEMMNVSTDANISTKSARSLAGGIQFGDAKGGGKGLNNVQGKVSNSDLYDPKAKFGSMGGGSMSLSGPGSIPESEIEKALSKFMSKFQYCYEKALLTDSSLGGNVVFKWTIESSGKASGPKVVKSKMNNAQLHSCISDVLKSVPFPKPKGGTVEVTKTFTFSSATL